MKKSALILVLTILSFNPVLYSQIVNEPLNSTVYEYLDNMAGKGFIEFNDEIRPVSRLYIAKKLYELAGESTILNSIENDELNFYLKEFGIELKYLRYSDRSIRINGEATSKLKAESSNTGGDIIKQDSSLGKMTLVGKDPYGRLRLFSYEDDLFKINVSPILGYQFGSSGGSKYSHMWNGIKLYGYLNNNIGFSLMFNDNSEDGENLDKTKSFTPATGVIVAKSDLNNIQYSNVNASISTNWSWGTISINKDYLNWGYGQSGLIVLSNKAPSFPFIRLDIYPTPWLRFNYFHAWLSSDIIDSSSIYSTLLASKYSSTFRTKYLASHTLSVIPAKGLDISLGESIIYSDKLEISYLIPIMFFRLADHYLSQANNNVGGNSQFFLGVSSRNNLPGTHLYGTLFIDEVTMEGLFNSYKQRNQFGFTVGGSKADAFIENLTATLEFTKIYPFVYAHYIPVLTYQSSGYNIGHWMGNDVDLIYGALNYKFIRGLQGTIWGQYIRKGDSGTAADQYSQPQPPFLFGLRTYYTYFGFDMKYEITHELFAKMQFQTTKISKQQTDQTKTNQSINEFYLSLSYGI